MKWHQRLIALLRLSAPGHWSIMMISFLFGYLPAGSLDPLLFVAYLAALSVGYGFCQLLNRYTDCLEDAINLPERAALAERVGYPLIGRVGWALTLALFAVPLLFVSRTGWAVVPFMWAGPLGGIMYSAGPRVKGKPVAVLFNLAGGSVVPFLVGWVLQRGLTMPPPLVWIILLYFMTYGHLRNLPDVEGDRAAGLDTWPSVYEGGRGVLFLLVTVFLPYLAIAAGVAAGFLPARYLAMLTLVPTTLLVFLVLVGAETKPEQELSRVVVLTHRFLFLCALFLCYWPTPVGLLCVGAVTLYRVIAEHLDLDTRPFGLTLSRLRDSVRLARKRRTPWFTQWPSRSTVRR